MMPFKPKRSNLQPAPLQSPEAFNDLYQRAHLIVFRYIYGLHGGPSEDVEDLTAITFTRAWRARKRFEGDPSAAIGWLLKIARNLVIDDHRRRKTRPEAEDISKYIIKATGTSPEDRALRNEQLQILWQLLQELPAEAREIIVLRYLLDWRVKDIAAHLDKMENTISVAIRRTLQRLKQAWPHS
jgi:RNA polymerase sigma-70 factor (ECF subfamily)